jgi:hypothetical protein
VNPRPWHCLILGALLIGASGCGARLEPDAEAMVNVLDGQINGIVARVTKVRKSFETAQTNPTLKAAIEAEKLKAPLAAFDAELKEAKARRDKGVKELASAKDSIVGERAFDALGDSILDDLEEAEAPVARAGRIVDVMRSPGGGSFLAATISEGAAKLEPEIRRASRLATASSKKHPHKEDFLAGRIKELEDLRAKAREMSAAAEVEEKSGYQIPLRFAKAFVDGETAINQGLVRSADLIRKTEELDQTILITLMDMRADYTLTPGMSSWNEFSDYSREESRTLAPILISQAQFLEASRTGGRAKDQDRFLRKSGLVSQALPSGHTNSETWIEDLDAKFYHLTSATTNGQTLTQGWKEVSAFEYFENVGNLGMDILSKPYGFTMEEAIKVATPHGMALVGDRRYGRWRTGPNGDVWVWLAAWRTMDLLTRNRPYNRTEWGVWNTRHKGRTPFYGVKQKEDDPDTFGSYGSATSGNWGATTWARTGAPGRTDPTVRGIGEWWRGGGPGGGGK